MEQYFAALARLEKLTPLRARKLLDFFENDAEKIWQASVADFQRAGIEAEAAIALTAQKKEIDPAAELAGLKKIGAKVLPITSPDYPRLLKEIYDPPPVLFVRGDFPLAADDFSVAIVGTRTLSPYGQQIISDLGRELARGGVTIVSGLAAGGDAAAHQSALDVGGRTVAVLGCGIDQIYPPTNRRLADKILESGGAIISEYPIGVAPTKYTFPQRNRIVAGLSRGVLVSEAREKSGTLITAQLALDGNRDVFAVPGSIFSELSAGANNLLKNGARPVTSATDILEVINFETASVVTETRAVFSATEIENQILSVLEKEPRDTDHILSKIEISPAELTANLSLLEMKGLAKNLGGGQWVRL